MTINKMKWHTETRKISELKNWESNPRTITEEEFKKLKSSIDDLGNFDTLTINTDGTVIAGNQRLRVAIDNGDMEVEVSVPERKLTEDEIKKIGLISNRHSGQWDMDKLANEFEDILTELEFDDLMPEIVTEAEEDDYEEPEDLETTVVLGDVYQLGEHRLMCGDSTKIEDVEKLMNGEKADMVFTDPPYLMGFTGNVHADGSKSFNSKFDDIKNDKMSREDGDEFIYNIFVIISQFNIGAYYVCFYRLGLDYIFRALDKLNNKYKSLIIWSKGNHTLSNSDYMSKYEPIIYGWFGEHNFYGDRSNFDIWEIDRTKKNELHPTMKPIELCSKAIQNSSKENGKVLDLFGGSGSTLIACEQTNRKCYMMELDTHYCQVIIDRWEKFTGKEAKKI